MQLNYYVLGQRIQKSGRTSVSPKRCCPPWSTSPLDTSAISSAVQRLWVSKLLLASPMRWRCRLIRSWTGSSRVRLRCLMPGAENLRQLHPVWNLCPVGCAENNQERSTLAPPSPQGWVVIILSTEYQIATDHRLRDWPVVCCVQKRLCFRPKRLWFGLLRDFSFYWCYNPDK